MGLGVVSVKDKRRKSNGCQCSSLPGFSFWMEVVGCIFVSICTSSASWSAGLNLQPGNKAQVLKLFFQREEERGSHSQSCAASPLLDAAAALSLSLSIYLACSPNNEHHFECIDCDYYHYLGPHHNNKFLHSVSQQRSRYAVELLVLDDDGLGVVESIKTHGHAC